MENKEIKYYAPKLEDLFVGYIYKFKNGEDWEEDEITPLDLCTKTSGNNACENWFEEIYKGLRDIKTKYLDKEDIESLGWEYIGKNKFYTDYEDFQFSTIDENDNYLNYFMKACFKNNWIQIEEMGSDSLFQGKCPSINELKKIMELLGIN